MRRQFQGPSEAFDTLLVTEGASFVRGVEYDAFCQGASVVS